MSKKTPSSRMPSWSRDETILAYALLKRDENRVPGKNDPSVAELSTLLRQTQPEVAGRTETFRNISGVYMKLMNLRGADPSVSAAGLPAASAMDREVVADFWDQPDRLQAVAAAIRKALSSGHADLLQNKADEMDEEAEEGRILTKMHRHRERDRALIEKAKKARLKRGEKLRCEACDFSFEDVYGSIGSDFIEVHHTKPLSDLPHEGGKTKISDLALLCANCHRMVHRRRPWLSIEKLKFLLQQSESESVC